MEKTTLINLIWRFPSVPRYLFCITIRWYITRFSIYRRQYTHWNVSSQYYIRLLLPLAKILELYNRPVQDDRGAARFYKIRIFLEVFGKNSPAVYPVVRTKLFSLFFFFYNFRDSILHTVTGYRKRIHYFWPYRKSFGVKLIL